MADDSTKPTGPATKAAPAAASSKPRTLAVDIGGTGIKAMILDPNSKAITERVKIATPKNATPKKVIGIISELAEKSGEFSLREVLCGRS